MTPEAIGLHEIDGGEKPRLAEEIRPRVGHLRPERAHAAVERQLLERRRGFREQHVLQRGVRPIGQPHVDERHAERLHRLERGAIDVGGGVLVHPTREVADAQPAHRRRRVEIEMARHARHVAGIRSADRAQHEHRVLDRARHRPELVERPAERHRAGARHAAVRRAETGDAAAHAGAHDAAASLAAYREGDEPRGSRRAGTSARS